MLRIAAFILGLFMSLAAPARAADAPDGVARATFEAIGQQLALKLTQACPPAPPNSSPAFDACRQALFKAREGWQKDFAPFILWGGTRPDVRFEEASTTQFNALTWVTLYLPLFTFDGPWQVEYDPRENKVLLRMSAGFRSQLEPGQYPYPFWHSNTKWSAYLDMNVLTFYIDPESKLVTAVSRSRDPARWPNTTARNAPPEPFVADRWTWIDAKGQLQPEVTLFSGLYRADNPYLHLLDERYRDLAIDLRQGSCFVCHTPENPDGMRHLALFQTPAHAVGEIDRIIKDIETGRMPRESAIWSVDKLASSLQQSLLAKAKAFKRVAAEAVVWEAEHAERPKKSEMLH